MNFDSLIEFNSFIASERPGWSQDREKLYSDSYNKIAGIVSSSGEMAIVALFAIAQDCIKDQDATCE